MCSALLLSGSTVLAAGDEDADGDTTASSSPDGTFEVVAGVRGVVYSTGGRSGPKCSWDRYSNFDLEVATGADAQSPPFYEDAPDAEISSEELARREAELAEWWEDERRRRSQVHVTSFEGENHHVYDVRCPGFSGNLRLVPVDLDADDLIPGAYEVATGRIEPPIPDVSPPFDVPGYVNLGMWLAVEPVSIEPITAEAGPNTWVTITPGHVSIEFDFDNGDTRVCEGFGEPIVDLETFDEGPCGYTYREKLPNDESYLIEVGTTWNLPYSSSDGAGDLPPFTRSEVFAHNVDELQTVGRSN